MNPLRRRSAWCLAAPVWAAKQRVLCALNHSLQDALNYGFSSRSPGAAPASSWTRSGLADYPPNLDTPLPYLEFRYKRRVYAQNLIDDKQFAKLHNKGANMGAQNVQEHRLSDICALYNQVTACVCTGDPKVP
ncbi:Sh3 And Multiple Ankyrin Repeat Domains Protein 3 [Manis pentadactyla]|nr:Sh3 And Multiple Ankyrin Repeat Domains Protein 3 [Manis pentadactyla]